MGSCSSKCGLLHAHDGLPRSLGEARKTKMRTTQARRVRSDSALAIYVVFFELRMSRVAFLALQNLKECCIMESGQGVWLLVYGCFCF
ncbi:hypothetical protein BS78_04G112800 [Paspalum vaginatum]|nr:hypothetical protein BS78_04G106600 [Paspalum vaginatum]KAJ1278878.1 hypothetical protein BS78_04G112800 [Paspalum vaginatum]